MAGKLKPLDVEREIRPGKYPDGDGLYLVVASATSKNWSYRYWKDGKQRWLGLGSVKDVSLKDARLARDAARLRVKGDRSTPGVDIVQEKRAAREEAKAVEIKVTLPTFEQCAEIYIREHWSTWSKKHRNQWPSSLKRYAYPTIGKLTIPEIKPSHIYELLRPIWVEKRETANRVRGRIETIIAKNVDVDDTDFRNPAELTKQLREKLPRRPKRVVRHHPALPYAEAPQFMVDISGAAGTAASMLCFLIFTACRTNEVVEARWSEIDRALVDLEDSRRTHENGSGPRRAAFRPCTRNPGQDARWHPGRIDLSKSRRRSIFGECDARRTGSPRIQSRYGARIPLDVRNLGRGMHGLS